MLLFWIENYFQSGFTFHRVDYKVYYSIKTMWRNCPDPYTGEPVFGFVVGMPEPSVDMDMDMFIVHPFNPPPPPPRDVI